MVIRVISSNSKSGNAYILEHDKDRLLLDAGVGMDDIYKSVNFELASIQGVLLTHFHKDHSKSVKDLLRLFVDTYMSQECADIMGITSNPPNLFIVNQNFWRIKNWRFTSFPTFHDASGSVGYFIKHVPTGTSILFITDTGFIKYVFPGMNVLLTECNYTDQLIDKHQEEIGDRYIRLKGNHMSLERLKSYLSKTDKTALRQIVLLHLSDSNSDAERMLREIKEATGAEVSVADAGMVISLDETPF